MAKARSRRKSHCKEYPPKKAFVRNAVEQTNLDKVADFTGCYVQSIKLGRATANTYGSRKHYLTRHGRMTRRADLDTSYDKLQRALESVEPILTRAVRTSFAREAVTASPV